MQTNVNIYSDTNKNKYKIGLSIKKVGTKLENAIKYKYKHDDVDDDDDEVEMHMGVKQC